MGRHESLPDGRGHGLGQQNNPHHGPLLGGVLRHGCGPVRDALEEGPVPVFVGSFFLTGHDRRAGSRYDSAADKGLAHRRRHGDLPQRVRVWHISPGDA